ncbi:Nitrilase [Lachnellula occidentalis]|uniref:Nitrilase n=1 Tax=Lachnellula occidentalis TaxID=215460 RepID=A0A8H8RX81_9HELO|nr:Nitrilase [Lachnellula occidentalis]
MPKPKTLQVAAVQAAPVSFDLKLSLNKLQKLTAEAALAVAIPSPEFDVLRDTAERNKIMLSVGIIEKEGGTLYCTAVLIGKDGKLLTHHRKLIPTAAERLVWGRGAGDGLQVVDTEFGKMGGLIW